MIRINLLPFRAARKRLDIKKEMTVYALILAVVIVVIAYLQISSSSRLTGLGSERETARKEYALHQKNSRMAVQLKASIKEIQGRLALIRNLEENKGGPLNLLTDVALAVPEDRLWLEGLSEQGGTLIINGTAMNNDTVALFMTNLEKAESITSVDLKNTQLKDFPKYNLKASSFAITCKTALQKAPPESEQKKTDSEGKR